MHKLEWKLEYIVADRLCAFCSGRRKRRGGNRMETGVRRWHLLSGFAREQEKLDDENDVYGQNAINLMDLGSGDRW